MLQPLSYSIRPSSSETISASDFTIESFLIHVRVQHCSNCGRTHNSSQVFEVHIHPRLTGTTAARRLIPAKTLRGGISIGHSILKAETTPCCHECFSTLKSESLPAPELKPLDPQEWAATLKRKYASPSPKETARPTPSAKRQPTLDDL